MMTSTFCVHLDLNGVAENVMKTFTCETWIDALDMALSEIRDSFLTAAAPVDRDTQRHLHGRRFALIVEEITQSNEHQ